MNNEHEPIVNISGLNNWWNKLAIAYAEKKLAFPARPNPAAAETKSEGEQNKPPPVKGQK